MSQPWAPQGRQLRYNGAVAETLKVNEIHRTLQGEGSRAGRPCVIVRLAGCNLRCRWCDTTYAYEEGDERSVDEVLAEVDRLGSGHVLITGGEPLGQPASAELMARLRQAGREVVLETNGSMDISAAPAGVARCVDVKCPGSGEGDSFLPANLGHLRDGDEVKFVLTDRTDYEYARDFLAAGDLAGRCAVILTPAAGLLEPARLAEWILADGLDVRMGLQLHKIIWPQRDRGV